MLTSTDMLPNTIGTTSGTSPRSVSSVIPSVSIALEASHHAICRWRRYVRQPMNIAIAFVRLTTEITKRIVRVSSRIQSQRADAPVHGTQLNGVEPTEENGIMQRAFQHLSMNSRAESVTCDSYGVGPNRLKL
jgi:hypothetical protein